MASRRLARALAERGVAVLRFDFTGLGSSAGDFANTHFSSNVDDLVHAADWLRRRHAAPSLLVGHSLGGAAVLAAAARIPEAVAVATIGAPADPDHVTGLFGEQRATIEEQGEAEVRLAGRPFRIRREFLADVEGSRLEESIRTLKKALLVLHSPIDNQVGIDHATRIFTAARHPKSFVSLDDADHLLSRPADARYAADVIAAWAERFLPPEPDLDAEAADQDLVLVEETGEGVFTNSIRAGRHALRADEPPSVGGEDTGPTPYGLLLASLGACTSMTLRLYAGARSGPWRRCACGSATRRSTPGTARSARPGRGRSTASRRRSRWKGSSTTSSGPACSRSPTAARSTGPCTRRCASRAGWRRRRPPSSRLRPPVSPGRTRGDTMQLRNVVLVDGARSAFARGARGRLVATRLTRPAPKSCERCSTDTPR